MLKHHCPVTLALTKGSCALMTTASSSWKNLDLLLSEHNCSSLLHAVGDAALSCKKEQHPQAMQKYQNISHLLHNLVELKVFIDLPFLVLYSICTRGLCQDGLIQNLTKPSNTGRSDFSPT